MIFNNQYNKLKENNRKYDEFAHKLIAESLKRWSGSNPMIQDKIIERLKNPQDSLDSKVNLLNSSIYLQTCRFQKY